MMPRLSVLLVAAILCAAAPAAAQLAPPNLPGWSLVPSLRTAIVREDNLPLGSERRTGSLIRITPAILTRFDTPGRLFEAQYLLDGEAYAQPLGALDDPLARQLGVFRFATTVSTTSSLSGEARYLSTHRPEQVFDEAGLIPDRRRTTTAAADVTYERRLSPLTRGRFGYRIKADDFGPPTATRQSARSTIHTAAVGFHFERTPRTRLALEYSGDALIGEDVTSRLVRRETFGANTVAFGWTYALTERVTSTLRAGPRVQQIARAAQNAETATDGEWAVRPEILASIARQGERHTVRGSYTRTAFLGYGAQGFVDTEVLEGQVTYNRGERLRLAGRAALYRNTLAGVRANSHRLDGVAAYRIARWVSLEVTYLLKDQSRQLSPADDERTRQGRRVRNSVMIGLAIDRPLRLR